MVERRFSASDAPRSNELIAEAREALGRINIHAFPDNLAYQYRGGVLGRNVTEILRDVADALEAATRVPVQGEPDDDREELLWNIEDRLKLLEAGAREPLIRKMAWTEGSTAEVLAIVGELRGWVAMLSRVTVPDAATAAIERVRAIHWVAVDWDGEKTCACGLLDCPTIAALDGAPEPEAKR